MPFFSRTVALGIGEEAEILNIAPGVAIKALRILVDGAHGAVAYIAARPAADIHGFPMYAAIAYNGAATDPVQGGIMSFSAEELKCLTKEDKKLFACAGGSTITIYIFGVMEY